MVSHSYPGKLSLSLHLPSLYVYLPTYIPLTSHGSTHSFSFVASLELLCSALLATSNHTVQQATTIPFNSIQFNSITLLNTIQYNQNQMGFFTSVKNAGLKTKLYADISVLDREAVSRKKRLGVELYNLLVELEKSKRQRQQGMTVQSPAMFHAKQDSIKVPLDACRADVGALQDRREALEQELLHMEANRDRGVRRHSESSFQQAAGRVSDTARQAKIHTQMKLLDRDVYQRQELFGLQVYDDIIVANTTSLASTSTTTSEKATTEKAKKSRFGGVKAGISNRLSKLSSDETAIEECIEKAKKDVNFIQTKKDRKEREIAQLDEESAATAA
jgi:hypothetical protein